MGTTYAAPAKARQETPEDCFQRLLQEAAEMNPQQIGSPDEIRRDALSTYESWSSSRRRLRKGAWRTHSQRPEYTRISNLATSGKHETPTSGY